MPVADRSDVLKWWRSIGVNKFDPLRFDCVVCQAFSCSSLVSPHGQRRFYIAPYDSHEDKASLRRSMNEMI